ncbi:RNA methyltransferase [Lactobacillus sp. DCY120]|uniref:RNA methyltransferase n=1 Tax=Bombilactobacillus apium TaxID=2675299 RepID=A0A850R877_9LACO|nr:RNA methyltransferase [Bombilactobacillus apium]NVY96912.1 RNA methyltransferase [Bombilactobacillus apium]
MQYLASPKNNSIKELKKLATARGRRRQGRYLLEGEHLVEEALQNHAEIQQLYVTTKFLQHDPKHLVKQLFDQTTEISEAVAQELTATVHPQGIFAVLTLPQVTLPSELHGKWLLLERIQDPGNLGTMIRTADAAGLQGVIISPDSADVWQSKVQRAMQGSQFHLPIITAELAPMIRQLKQEANLTILGTLVDAQAQDYQNYQAPADWALIMGNEAGGLTEATAQLTDQNLYIPLRGQAESLNVAIAAGILMYSL